MAYICGIVTKEERATLESRGWEIEKCPSELIPDGGNPNDDYIIPGVRVVKIGIGGTNESV